MTESRVQDRYRNHLFGQVPVWHRRLRWALGIFIGVHVVLAMISGYRAIVQVYELRIVNPPTTIAPGSRLEAAVVTSGRTTVAVRLELLQGREARLLGIRDVAGNRDGAYDPRPRRGALAIRLSAAMLDGATAGPGVLRATAIGRSQWLRVPPPTTATAAVLVQPE
jgi:hypothetical protein